MLVNALTTRRPEPYVWVSWLTKLLTGESSCTWSSWLRAHYQPAKVPSVFDVGTWQMEHAAMLRRTVAEYEQAGYKLFTEEQNSFVLRGRCGTLSGKPDVVAVADAAGWIVDAKTGAPKASDRVQVMLYMWCLPKAFPAYAGIAFAGKVVYKTGYQIIRPDEIDETFVKRVGEMMKLVCAEAEPRKAPSLAECLHCSITREDCPERVEAAKIQQGETEEF